MVLSFAQWNFLHTDVNVFIAGLTYGQPMGVFKNLNLKTLIFKQISSTYGNTVYNSQSSFPVGSLKITQVMENIVVIL